MNIRSSIRAGLLGAMALAGLATLTLPSAPASACAFCGTYYVVNVPYGDVLYMRKWPSAQSRIVGAIPRDGQGVLKVGGCKSNWCKMKYNGTVGWVNMRYLRYIP